MDFEKEPVEPEPVESSEFVRAELFMRTPEIPFGEEDLGDFTVELSLDAAAIEKDRQRMQAAADALGDSRLYLVVDRTLAEEIWRAIVADAELRQAAMQRTADELGLGNVRYDYPQPNWPETLTVPGDHDWEGRAQATLMACEGRPWPGGRQANAEDILNLREYPWSAQQMSDMLVYALSAVESTSA